MNDSLEDRGVGYIIPTRFGISSTFFSPNTYQKVDLYHRKHAHIILYIIRSLVTLSVASAAR